MFKIGDFARFSRVSIKMLRHYDTLGLLKPAWVDPDSEYRYYTADQLPRLNRIIALKDLGFTLDQIARLLDSGVSAEELRGMLTMKRAEIERRVQAEQARLAQVEARLRQIEQEATVPAYDVVVRSVEAQLVASIREASSTYDRIEPLFNELERHVAQNRVRAEMPPLTLYHHCVDDVTVDLETAVPITGNFAAKLPTKMPICVYELPAVTTMACVIHSGAYTSLINASDTLMKWIAASGYESVGPCREVYLRFGAHESLNVPRVFLTQQDDDFVTELQAPIRAISG